MPLTAPTLSMVDHEDGGGATATLVGGDAAATNTLFALAVDGGFTAGEWTAAGSRTGFGAIDLTLPAGYHWGRCDSTLAGETAVSNLVYFRVSRGADSVYSRCLDAAAARIRLLALEDLAADGVRVRKLASDRDLGDGLAYELPCVLVTPDGQEQADAAAGTIGRDDIGYAVRITLLAADDQDLENHLPRYLGWRERIARAFRNQKLPSVSEVFTCAVEPREVMSHEAWRDNLWQSALVLRFFARETRGLT